MRFKYLDLMSFGCFTDYRIDFDPERMFHLIYGANEAGKSTFLRAITDVLYGIPERTGDAYLHPSHSLRIGAGLVHHDGRELSFMRRKGRTKTLLNLDGTPLDQAALESFLGGLNRETFQLMFGLNHERLTEGGKRLIQSGGSVGESLFEAASGISGLRELLNELYEDARILFKPSGKNPPINEMIARYREARRQVTELSLAARSWTELEARYDREKRAVNDLTEKRKRLDENKTRLERVSRTLPLLSRRNEYQSGMEQLGDVPLLPETARSERLELQKRLDEAEKTKQTTEDKMKRLEQKQQNLDILPGILEQNRLISELYESLSQYRHNVTDVPRIQGEIAGIEQSINSLMREVYPQASSLEEAERLRPPLIRLEKVREIAAKHPVLMEKLQNVEADIAAKKRAVEENQNKRKKLGPLKEIGPLRVTIQRAQKKGNLEATLQETRRRARQLQMRLAADLEQLNLWTGDLDELEHLLAPMAATVETFADRTAKVQGRIEQVERDIEKVQEEVRGIEARLDQIEFRGDVPTQQDLTVARKHREMGWGLVRRAWLEGDPDLQAEQEFSPDKHLPEAYEEAVMKADDMVDRMRLASEQVASKATLCASRQNYLQQLADLTARKTGLESNLKRLEDEWKKLWQPCAIDPLSPKEMLSWLNRYDRIIEQVRSLRDVESTAVDLEKEIERHRDEIGKAIIGLGEQVADEERLEDLILRGQEFCSAIDRVSGSLERLEEEAVGLQQQLQGAGAKQIKMQEELAGWHSIWEQAMKEMALPQDTTPGVARALVDRINQLFEEIDDLKTKRIAEQQKLDEIRDFEARIKNLLEKIPVELSGLTPDMAVAELRRKSEESSKAQAALDEITRQLEELEEERLAAVQEISLVTLEQNNLMARASCQSLIELEKAEELSERARELQKKINEMNERLLESGDGLSLEQIAIEAEEIDPDTLPGEIQEIINQLNDLEAERSRREQQFGATRKEYEQKVDGNSTIAIEAAEEAENILARLEQEVARYIRLRLAAAMLRMGVERYRELNQNPVVKSAGKFFDRLTLKSFSGLTVDYDANDNPILLGVRSSGKTVGVEGMSDGTQDQLYLSLRLASIEKYLKDIEPMPIVVDDILINFDDERSKETLRVLASLSELTQVIFFTHHRTIITLAKEAIPETVLSVYNL